MEPTELTTPKFSPVFRTSPNRSQLGVSGGVVAGTAVIMERHPNAILRSNTDSIAGAVVILLW